MIVARIVLVGLFTVIAANSLSAKTLVTTEGMGPVRIGMTVDQVEKALGAKFDLDPRRDNGCWVTSRTGGDGAGILYGFNNGELFTIGIKDDGVTQLPPADTAVETATGIGLGNTKEDLSKSYGAEALTKKYFDYQPEWDSYIVSEDGKRAIKFELNKGVVTLIFVGTLESFLNPDICSEY